MVGDYHRPPGRVKDQIGVSIPGDDVTYVIELPVRLEEDEVRQLTNRIETILQCVAQKAQDRLRKDIRQMLKAVSI